MIIGGTSLLVLVDCGGDIEGVSDSDSMADWVGYVVVNIKVLQGLGRLSTQWIQLGRCHLLLRSVGLVSQ